MNNFYVNLNLIEAKSQLDEIVDQFESLDKVEVIIQIQHLYHHLNTAFNCLELNEDECFQRAGDDDFYIEKEKFPLDLF